MAVPRPLLVLLLLFFVPPCSPQSKSRACPCNLGGLWLDLIILVDRSASMTTAGVAQVTADIATLVYQIPVSQRIGQFSRVSLISFASEATVVGDLRAFNSSEEVIQALFTINADRNDSTVNIQKALQAAGNVSLTSQDASRSNVRTAIIIYSSAFMAGTFYDPHAIANQLKDSGITIITVAFRQSDESDEVFKLAELASRGFNLSNEALSLLEDLGNATCQVNCFCPNNWRQLADSFSSPIKVYGECLRYVDIDASWTAARVACHNTIAGGYLASELDSTKHRFDYEYAMSVQTNPTGKIHFHIGLSAWANNTYGWEQPNGQSPIPLDSSYTVWTAGYPDTRFGNCISVLQQTNTSFRWVNEECATAASRYLCQSATCDTSNYCATLG